VTELCECHGFDAFRCLNIDAARLLEDVLAGGITRAELRARREELKQRLKDLLRSKDSA
jgi:hypothetical protein